MAHDPLWYLIMIVGSLVVHSCQTVLDSRCHGDEAVAAAVFLKLLQLLHSWNCCSCCMLKVLQLLVYGASAVDAG
jgi:hypothetical protein